MEEDPQSSASSKKLKITDTDSVDRLSELPESLLGQILSLLDTKQAVHTSLLSKTWRYTWRSVSNLILDHSIWPDVKILNSSSYRAVPRKPRFAEFVDEMLDVVKDSNVDKLYLDCGPYCAEDKVNEWIRVAARSLQVKEIDLKISCKVDHQLPKSIFSQAVTKFMLNSYDKELKGQYLSVRLPRKMLSSAALRTLELISARLPDGKSKKELKLKCPVLEHLVISECDHYHLKGLVISASNLKTLDICNDLRTSNSLCAIYIRTPNLETLSLQGNLYEGYHVDDLPALVSADIITKNEVKTKNEVFACAKHLINIFKGIYSVRTLRLSNQLSEIVNFQQMLKPDVLPTEFSNLRTLTLKWSESSCIQVITNLLRSSNIETLVIQANKAGSSNGYPGEKLASQYMLHDLKNVEFQNYLGTRNQCRILEYLLDNASSLEKLTIGLSPFLSAYKEKEEASIRKKLPNQGLQLVVS